MATVKIVPVEIEFKIDVSKKVEIKVKLNSKGAFNAIFRTTSTSCSFQNGEDGGKKKTIKLNCSTPNKEVSYDPEVTFTGSISEEITSKLYVSIKKESDKPDEAQEFGPRTIFIKP